MKKVTSLSLRGTTGSIVKNADGTHESSVIHVTGTDKVSGGQVALMIPLNGEEDAGLEPGEYSISISLVRSANAPADGNGPLLTEESLKAPVSGRRAADRA